MCKSNTWGVRMVIKERALIWRVVTMKSENIVYGEFRVVSLFPKLRKGRYFIALRIAIVWMSAAALIWVVYPI